MLRNRQEKEENLIKGVNLVANPTKLELGYFTSLANWIPSKKYKIKKKRGPTRLSSDPQTVDPIVLGFGTLVDCETTTPPGVVGTCDECLTVDTDGTLIAKSAELTVPCFCFYAPQICSNGVRTVQATFKAVIAGSPISGIVLAVPPDATDTSFSGYALIYDPGHATQKLKIVEWNTASLAALGTIKSSANTTLVADDIIKLTYDSSTGELKAYINDTLQSALNVTDTSLVSATNEGMGIVVVGTAGADDRMRWDDLAGSCEGTTIPIVCSEPTFTFSEDFVFGMNSFDGSAQPPEWITAADWIIPDGTITCGSCDPGITGTLLKFDISSLNCFGAIDPPCADLNLADQNACIDIATSSSNWSANETMRATYVSESNQGISGIAWLIEDSTISNTTGYGLLIDRSDDTAKFVQWSDESLDNPTILWSETYIPTAGDQFILDVQAPVFPFDGTYNVIAQIYNAAGDTLLWPGDIADTTLLIVEATAVTLKQGSMVTLTNLLNNNGSITYEMVVSNGSSITAVC